MAVSGVTVNASEDIRRELAAGNGTIRIEICYNKATLNALGIDASTLAIWKYNSTTEKWVQQSSTRSKKCVYVDMNHLCAFGLFGSKPTDSGSSSRKGIYPPGGSKTPAPTATATKAPVTGTATDAPPDERVTQEATKMPAAAKVTAKKTTTAAEGTANKGAPGFTAAFVIAGLLAVAYAMMRRRG